MIDTDKEERRREAGLFNKLGCIDFDVVDNLLIEVLQLREESKKKGNVLSTLDEMIRHRISHVKMMKALEQGLDLPETWKEMIE